jgi:protein-S-isoprenylcysteine O-methyltransferase Ste14
MTTPTTAPSQLVRQVLARFSLGLLAFMALIFLPAGTWQYWQGWLMMAIIVIPLVFALPYMIRYAPDLMERRLHLREKETAQKRIVNLTLVLFVATYGLPGLDHRFGWSHVPVAMMLIAAAGVLGGYLFVLRVFAENRFASRVVEVEAGQQVISSGPYALVRHPMYAGSLMMYILSPLALGCWWAMVFPLAQIGVTAARIRNEEQVLLRDLEGYAAYMAKVKYRLVPGIW